VQILTESADAAILLMLADAASAPRQPTRL
jgi:hypothetical protein